MALAKGKASFYTRKFLDLERQFSPLQVLKTWNTAITAAMDALKPVCARAAARSPPRLSLCEYEDFISTLLSRIHVRMLPPRVGELTSLVTKDIEDIAGDPEHCWTNTSTGKGCEQGKLYVHRFPLAIVQHLQAYVAGERARTDTTSNNVFVDYQGQAISGTAVTNLLRHFQTFSKNKCGIDLAKLSSEGDRVCSTYFRSIHESAASALLDKSSFDLLVQANGHSGSIGQRNYQRQAARQAALSAFTSMENVIFPAMSNDV
jgi:integrase